MDRTVAANAMVEIVSAVANATSYDPDGNPEWAALRGGDLFSAGDVDGDGVDDVVAGSVRFYGIEPPYSVDTVDGSNDLLWSYPLDSIHNEPGFGLALANLDDDPALEVLVANGTQLLALDTVGEVPAALWPVFDTSMRNSDPGPRGSCGWPAPAAGGF